MLPYELTPLAEQDLKEIARYTLKEWGKKQSIRYARLLEDHFHGIANRTVTSRTVFEQFPDVYVTRCKHHYIFYLYQNGKRPRIIAVLHERMDMLTRIGKRLG